jgi:hypothetical protein
MDIAQAKKEYREFLSKHGLDDTSELASIYFLARAHNLYEGDMTLDRETFDRGYPDYKIWRTLSANHWSDALRSVKSLIAMEE